MARRITSNQAILAIVSRQLFTTTRVFGGVKAVDAAEVDSERRFFSIADKAFNEMERIERLFGNELKVLNNVAGESAYPCNKEVFEVIRRCYQYGVLTGDAFDVTVSPYVHLVRNDVKKI